MGAGHRAHQGESQAGPPGLPVLTGAEPVEDERHLVRRDAAAGIGDDDPGWHPWVVPDDRQLYDIVAAGMPDGVLEQRVERQAEPLPVGGHGHLVEPGDPP